MAVISGGDLLLLRQRKDTQRTIERLYLFGAPAMWEGEVSTNLDRGDRAITYTSGAMETGYSFSDIVAGLTLKITTTQGVIRRRIRSISGTAASGTITVDWHDDLQANAADVLVIEHTFWPWPKFSHFTASGPTFKKDGPDGETYTDQNESHVPLVLMGAHYANELPTSGSLVVQLDATESQVASGATISSYAWSAVPSTGVSFSNSAIVNPTVTISTEGKRWIYCQITDSNGNASTGRRAYMIGGGVTEFSRSPITAKFNAHSVDCTITTTSPDTGSSAIRPQVDWSDVVDGSLVMIAADDYYGTTQKTVSAQSYHDDHQRMVYAGYITGESDEYGADGTISTELRCQSMLDMYLYSISLTGATDPSDWYEMASDLMTAAGNLFHLFFYHSTMLNIADWHLPWSDTVKRSANEEFTQGGILEKARALTRARLMGFTGTPQGEIHIEQDINLLDQTDRANINTTLTLDSDDPSGSIKARARHQGDNIRVMVSGGSSDGVVNSFVPYLSASHEVARARGRASIISIDRLMLPSQTESNRLAGRIAAVANQRYEEINMSFSGGWRQVIGVAPQQWVNLGTVFSNHPRNGDLANDTVVPRQVTYSYDPATGVSSVTGVFEPEAFPGSEGLTGTTLSAPVIPSDNASDGTYDLPGTISWPIVSDNELEPGAAVVMDGTDGIYWTADSGSNWAARNGSVSSTVGYGLIWSPWWKTASESGSSNPENVYLWWVGDGFIRKSEDAGNNWADYTQYVGTPPNDIGDSPAPTNTDLIYRKIHGDIHNQGKFVVIATWQNGASTWRSWVLRTTDDGFTWTWEALATSGTGTDPSTFSWLLDADPDQESYADNDSVTTITNQGTANNGTGGNDPTFKTNIINGRSVYRFDGSNDYKTFGTSMGKPANYTIFTVFKMDSSSQMVPLSSVDSIGSDSTAWGVFQMNHSLAPGGFLYIFGDDTNGSRGYPSAAHFNANTFYVMATRYTNGDTGQEIWSYGNQLTVTEESTSASSVGGTAYEYAMGRNGEENADYFDGDIGRTLITNTAMSDLDIQNISIWLMDYYGFTFDEVMGLEVDLDNQSGGNVYITSWNGDELMLETRTSGNLLLSRRTLFGTVTEAQVLNRTYYIAPYAPSWASVDTSNTVFIYGRYDDGSVKHLTKSTDGGLTFGSNLGDGTWGSDWVGAFVATDSNTFYAFVNGASPGLWRSTNGGTGWTKLSVLPVDVDAEAVSFHPDGRLLISSRDSGAAQAYYADSNDNYATWTNISTGLPTSDGKPSAIWVV